MEFLLQYGLFLAEVVTVVIAVAILASVIISLSHRGKHEEKPVLCIQRLNDVYEDYEDQLNATILNKPEYKHLSKQKNAKRKAEEKEQKSELKRKSTEQDKEKESENQAQRKRRVFVLDFEGDVKASGVEDLARSVTAVLMVAEPQMDEIVLKLESAGGLVHSYGLAAAQLERIRASGLNLTVAIDRVAASGGYMMAAVAHRIIAAPFAIIGSIGVVAQIPNFNRLLKKHEVDLEFHTAGQYKRTLTLFGENTQEGRAKFKDELNETHQLFKAHLEQHRPSLDLDNVATGEHWYGVQAQPLNLIDDVMTSDEYLAKAISETDVFEVTFEAKKSVADKLLHLVSMGAKSTLKSIIGDVHPASKIIENGVEDRSSFSRVRFEADHSN